MAGEGTATEAGGEGGAPAAGAESKTYTGADLSSKFSEGYNSGIDKALKDVKADLRKHFGTESLEEAAALFTSKKGAPEHAEQLTKMSQQLTELEGKHKHDRLLWHVQAAIAGDAHNPKNTAETILKEFDIQIDENGRETVTRRRTKELVLADGKQVTARELVQLLSKDPEFSYQFKTASTQAQGQQKQSKFNDTMLTDPSFVQALRATDQYFAFINNKPVDEEKVLAAWKKS